jgi:hypothetical protein
MNSLRLNPNRARHSRSVCASMPHAVMNSCAILPVRRPHAALLARAQKHVKRSRASRRFTDVNGTALALDY